MAPVAIDSSVAPPKVVGPATKKTKKATRPSTQNPQYMIDETRMVTKESFDPSKHLDYTYQYPKRIYTMEEIGLENQGISPNAASEPFPLFTEDAIRQIRAEVFGEESLRNCQYTSTFAKNMIRGMGPA